MITITFTTSTNPWELSTVATIDASSSITIIYYYLNGKKIKSLTAAANVTQVVFDEPIKNGDIITCNYYRNRTISTFSNKLVVPQSNITKKYDKSFLAKVVSSTDTIISNWSSNVFDKLQKGKILARYVKRENSEDSNSDFIAFWTTLTDFFAYYIGFADKLSSIDEVEIYLRAFLLQRNIFVTDQENLQQLQYLTKNFYKELQERGTVIQFEENPINVRGEFLRAIAHQFYDELIVLKHSDQYIGWNIGNNSPLYRGFADGFFNKITKLQDLSIIGTISEQIIDNIPLWTINQQNYFSHQTGNQKMFTVNEDTDYQITLLLKTNGEISIGIDLFDAFKKLINQPLSTVDGSSTNFFLNNFSINTNNKFVFLRCIIYNKSKASDVKSKTNLGGNNLTMFPGVSHFSVIIESSAEMIVKGLEIKPLSTKYSLGFIQANNIVSLWLSNRSGLQIDDLKQRLVDYLFPYHTYPIINELELENGIENECGGTQNPNFISTTYTRCRVDSNGVRTGVVERLFIDNNPCTNKTAEWHVDGDSNLDCSICPPLNTIIGTIYDHKTEAPFYSFNSKLWKTRKTVRKANGSCGFTTVVTYENEYISSTDRPTDPIWENSGAIYCDETQVCLNDNDIDMEVDSWTIEGSGNCLERPKFPAHFYIEPNSDNFDFATIQMNFVQIHN